MKEIIFVIIFAIHNSALVNSFEMLSEILEHYPNKCNDDVDMKPFVRIGQKYYFIEITQKLTWINAAHACRAMDANLATIESEDEMNAISQHLVALGLNDVLWTSGNDIENEGNFRWLSTGKPMVYTKWWATGQPDNLNGIEHCVHLKRINDEYFMNDVHCYQQDLYICEAKTPKTIVITIM